LAFGWGSLFSFAVKVYQAYTIYEAAKEDEETANKNAQLMIEMAEATKKKYAYEEQQKRKQTLMLLSSQKAAAGSSGLKISSFNPIYENTLSEGELDALAIRQQGNVESGQYKAKAEIYAKAGKQSKKAGLWGAGESLLQGGSDLYGDYKASKIGE